MLDQLVESKSNVKENTRRSEFMLITLFLAIAIVLALWTQDLFAQKFGMGTDDLSLTTLVAPVPVPDEEPPPKEETKPKEEVATDVRKELIASIDMSPKEPPKISTEKMTKMTIRDAYNVKLGDTDSNATVKAEGPGRIVESGSSTGLAQTAPETKVIDEDAPPPPPKKAPPKTISGGVLNGKATSLPVPVYPPAARAINAKGTVTVQVTIDESGRVISASASSGHPLLRAAAVSAAQRAKFSPTLLTGQPVKVTGVITYNFN
ncbi:MAG: energy transducer TonB [Pyrinomonadaceae bacterium]